MDLDQFYVSKDGDVLDQIVFNHYGNTTGRKVATVLTANPGLAALGAVLDAGVRVSLPVISDNSEAEAVKLWD